MVAPASRQRGPSFGRPRYHTARGETVPFPFNTQLSAQELVIERFQHVGEQTTESPEWNSDRKRSGNVWVGGGHA